MSLRLTLRRGHPLGFWLAMIGGAVCFGWPGADPSWPERGLWLLGCAIVFRLFMLEDAQKERRDGQDDSGG